MKETFILDSISDWPIMLIDYKRVLTSPRRSESLIDVYWSWVFVSEGG